MKLKKAALYFGSFALLCAMFITCYYISYLRALNNFNEKAIEHKTELLELTQSLTPTPAEANDETVMTNEEPDITVQPDTNYVLETYNMKTEQTETQELNPPAYLVGLTRDQVEEYLTTYMDDMPLSEYNKGLISFELVRFSSDTIVLRKSYNEDFVPFRFYVVVKDGYIVVYNSDLKSVYKNTHILASELSEEDRINLSQGIYVNSLDELYSLLESFSS